VDLAFHDARSASASFVRGWRTACFSGAPDRAVPLTPPSLPFIEFRPRFRVEQSRHPGLPRPLPSSLREDETLSSIRGAFHRRGTPTLMRGSMPARSRSRVLPRRTGPRRHFTLGPPKSRACALLRGYRELRSPSPPVVRLALFTRNADLRFSGSGYRPTTSATNYDARTHSRASDSRLFVRPAFCGDVERALDLAMLFYGTATAPPSKSHDESCEPRQSFQSQLDGAASAPQNETPKATFRPRRRLRATPRSDHRLRRWPLENSDGLRGPSRPERRTFLTPPAAAERRGRRRPSSNELLEHPFESLVLRTTGWMFPSSS
jgi:hypothetical protein